MPDVSTDTAWEEWGRVDPYYAVITDPRFRRACITEEDRRYFFESGRLHVEYVLQMVRTHIDGAFQPRSVLEFGCGVGRLLVPFARIAEKVVGLDVSPSMLQEARRNCDEQGVGHAITVRSDDTLSVLQEEFDLVHSFIVFQHIPADRGTRIFRALLSCLRRGGVGAFQFLYSRRRYAATNGVDPHPAVREPAGRAPGADPDMQMNVYDPTEVLFALQSAGVLRFHAEFTDHAGELGAFLFFQKP